MKENQHWQVNSTREEIKWMIGSWTNLNALLNNVMHIMHFLWILLNLIIFCDFKWIFMYSIWKVHCKLKILYHYITQNFEFFIIYINPKYFKVVKISRLLPTHIPNLDFWHIGTHNLIKMIWPLGFKWASKCTLIFQH